MQIKSQNQISFNQIVISLHKKIQKPTILCYNYLKIL